MSTQRPPGAAISPASAALPALLSVLSLSHPVDDAFIVFRYVDRFLRNLGLTFNDGEWIEGFTSLLWTLLLIVAGWVGLPPPQASVVLNFIFIAALGPVLLLLLNLLSVSHGLKIAAVGMYACSFLYFRTVFLGLEFGLFSLVLVLFCFALFKAIGAPDFQAAYSGWSVVAGILGGLLFMTRPEFLLLPPAVVIAGSALRTYRHAQRTLLRGTLVTWLASVGAITLIRLVVYGDWLPNSVLAKSISLDSILQDPLATTRSFAGGAWYFARGYVHNPGLLVILLLLLLVALRRGRELPELILLGLPIAYQHAVIVLHGGDWMEFHRFLNVLEPLVIVCGCVAAQRLQPPLKASRRWLLAGVAVAYAIGNTLSAHPELPRWSWYLSDRHAIYGEVAAALDPIWLGSDSAAFESVGMGAYRGPAIRVLDADGLTSAEVRTDPASHRSIYGRRNWKLLLGKRPAIILVHSPSSTSLWDLFQEELAGHYDFFCLGPRSARLGSSTGIATVAAAIRQDRVPHYLPEIQALPTLTVSAVDVAQVARLQASLTTVCERLAPTER